MGLRVAFATSNKPKKLYVPPLFNISGDLRVCIALPEKEYSNVEDMTREAIAAFWATEFNDGMFDAFDENYSDTNLLAWPQKWQHKTKSNLGWKPSARSMKEFKESFTDFCKSPFAGGRDWDNGSDGDEYNYDEDEDY